MTTEAEQEIFAGKFRLVKLLGRGAMGEVWLANEVGPRNFHRQVALKRLLATEGISDYARESFVAEAQVIARLDHPNIVRLIELGESDDRGLYLVLDYIDGAALDRIIRKGGALSPGAVALIGREVARALDAVHSMCDAYGQNLHVVHRDVSPANILVGRDGRVRLSDFGVARIHGLGGEKTETGVFKGKLPYMPPEQALGEPFDGRADLFSLGITIYEALIGGRLRRAETQGQLIAMIATERVPRVHETVPDAHPGLSQAIDYATEFRSEQRVPSAGHLAHMLHQVLHTLGPGAEEAAMNELCERVARVTGGAAQTADKRPWSLALSGENAAASGPHSMGSGMAQSGANPSLSYASPQSFVSPRTSPSGAYPIPSGVMPLGDGDPTLAQVPASVPPPGHASVTRIASITDASAAQARAGGAKTWVYAIVAAVLLGGGLGAVFVMFGAKPTPAPPETTIAAATGAPTPPVILAATSVVTSPVPGDSASAAEPAGSASSAPSSRTRPGPGPVRTNQTAQPPPTSTGDESGTGTLTVTANPWGNVTVDGRSYGSTPMAGISLPAGPHTVVVTNPELGASRSASVKIKSGQSQSVRFDFKKND
jgi:serine/threonine-protein kinase